MRDLAPGISLVAVKLGVHGVPATNCYLLWDDQEGHVLVDCGAFLPAEPSSGITQISSALAARGAELSNVRALLVTHAHIDHYGLAGLVLRNSDAELWMHASAHMDLLAYAMPERERQRLDRVLASHGVSSASDRQAIVDSSTTDWAPYLYSVVEPNVLLWGGEHLSVGGRVFEVLHTPGHSRSHVCLWSGAERLLLSGDHMLPGITPPINFHHGLDDDPLGQFIEALERIEALDPALVLPGHGRPFGEGGRRARSIVASKRRRLELTLEALGEQPMTVRNLTALVYENAVAGYQLKAAMAEVLGQLAYLKKRGLVERVSFRDGTVGFKRVQRGTSA